MRKLDEEVSAGQHVIVVVAVVLQSSVTPHVLYNCAWDPCLKQKVMPGWESKALLMGNVFLHTLQ